jgi:hypothetical protein
VPERLTVPFEAIKGFFDPSVQFGLQFEEVTEGEERPAPANAQEPATNKKRRAPASMLEPTTEPVLNSKPAAVASSPKREKPEKPNKPASSGEVVRLDRFRKK